MWTQVFLLCSAAALAQTSSIAKIGGTTSKTQLQSVLVQTDLVVLWGGNGALNPQVLASFPVAIRALYTTVSTIPIFDLRKFSTKQDLFLALTEVSKLSPTVYQSVLTLTIAPAAFPVANLQQIPMIVFSMMRRTNLLVIARAFSNAQRAALCGRLLREHVDTETAESIVESVDCIPTFVSLRLGYRIDAVLAYSLLEGIKKRHPISGWSNTDWSNAMEIIQGIDPDDVPRIPTAVILANLPKISAILPKLTPRLRTELVNRINLAVGGFSRFSAAQMRLLAPFFSYFSISTIRSFPKAMLPQIASLLSRVSFKSEDVKQELGQLLRQQMGDPKNWTSIQFKSSGVFVMPSEYSMQQINYTILYASLAELGADKRSEKEAIVVMDCIRRNRSMQQPSQLGNTNFLNTSKHLLIGLEPSFLAQIPGPVWVSVFKDLKNVEFGRAQARAIWNVMKGHLPKPLSQMTRSEIEDLKPVLPAISGVEINQFNAVQLTQAFANIGDSTKLGKGKTTAVLNRINTQPGGVRKVLLTLGASAKFASPMLMKNASDAELGTNASTQLNSDCKDAQCKIVFERIKKTLGNLAGANFTVTAFKNMGKACIGMSADDVKQLPKGRVLRVAIAQVCKYSVHVPTALLQSLAMKFKAEVNITYATNLTQRITRRVVMESACLFKVFSVSELESMGKKHCRTVLNTMSSMPMDDISKQQLKGLFRFALSCLNRTTRGARIGIDDLKRTGNVICGIESSDLEKFNKSVILNFVSKIGCKCNFGETMRRKIVDKFIKDENVSLSAPANTTLVPKLRCLLASLTPNELSRIPWNVLLDMCQDFTDSVAEERDNRKSRAKQGQTDDRSSSDKTANKQGIQNVVNACTAARRTQAARSAVASGRKRRQTTALSCSQIKAMGPTVTFLTSAQILSMSDADFLNCADFLGNETEWTAQQIASLATVALRATTWGTPNTWSTNNIEDAGKIAQGLTPSQISTLSFTSMDGITALGAHSGWSSAQLTAGFAKWLADYKSGSAAAINHTELSGIGHFACGATATDISAIPASSYGGAAADIGELDSCYNTLTDWAVHAVTVFGHVSNWAPSDVASVAVVIGGLSSSNIANFSSAQIQSIPTAVIPYLPASAMASFSPAQLEQLSNGQALAVTYTQQQAMTNAQLDALEKAGAQILVSGATTLFPCLLLWLPVLTAAVI